MTDNKKLIPRKQLCFKDHCLRIQVWVALLAGFLLLFVGLPIAVILS
ncbi:MAG: hypothetical protein GY752_08100 [bacterium]|nr:hypothetical protein [bacterium]MCP4798869.1 hypothetical protein [bacterium]